jgi:hypothetical protein
MIESKRKKTAMAIKYMRKTAGYTGKNYKKESEFEKEINLIPVLDKIHKKVFATNIIMD